MANSLVTGWYHNGGGIGGTRIAGYERTPPTGWLSLGDVGRLALHDHFIAVLLPLSNLFVIHTDTVDTLLPYGRVRAWLFVTPPIGIGHRYPSWLPRSTMWREKKQERHILMDVESSRREPFLCGQRL